MILTENLIKSKCKTDNLGMIRALNICGMALTDVSILWTLPNLEIISLSANQIQSLSDFAGLKNLRELYLRNNKISLLNELLHLKDLSHLRVLWLNNNPVSELSNYRSFVAKHLSNLQSLDNSSITFQEREFVGEKVIIEKEISRHQVSISKINGRDRDKSKSANLENQSRDSQSPSNYKERRLAHRLKTQAQKVPFESPENFDRKSEIVGTKRC